jgi:drug/metabolite transporter (DMT)-like permease
VPSPAHSAFAVLALVWGSNFLFMKWSTDVISAGQTALLRVLFGFVPIAIYALARGVFSPRHLRYVHHFAVMSVLSTSVHYFALASGGALLDSGIAGAVTGSIPLFSLLGSAVLLRSERITTGGVLGIAGGLAGVLLIARPWESGGAVSVIGVLWILLASAAFGLSIVYAKRFLVGREIHAAALTTYQMGFGLLALAAVTDLDGIGAIGGDARALTGLVVGLGLLGTGFAYILYYVVVEHLGAITAASSTYLPPVVAMAIGWLVIGESLTPLDALATALILAGVVGGYGSRPACMSSSTASSGSSTSGVARLRPSTEKWRALRISSS